MPLSLHTAALLRRLESQPSLHAAEKREPYSETQKALSQFSEAIDSYYPSLDESDADGALGQPGLVRYHTADGQRLQARFQGDSQRGEYLQEWAHGGFMLTRFTEDTVDNYQVGPRGSHHLHLDRRNPEQSFLTVEGAGAPLLSGGPVPAQPPSMPAEVKSTASGVSYGVLQAGQGAETADRGETVLVHYTGWLQDGTRFDSSRDKSAPFRFSLGEGRVIQGWEQGVEGMQAGEKRLLHIPAELAYGDRQRGPIPANSPLIFEVELLATSGELDRP